MKYETNDLCTCANCPGEACRCGCQASAPAAAMSYAGTDCNCGPNCGCEAGEQGCLCKR